MNEKKTLNSSLTMNKISKHIVRRTNQTDVVESFLRSWNEFPQKYLLLIKIVEKV